MRNKVVRSSKLIIYNIDNQDKEKQIISLCRQLGYNTRKIKKTDVDSSIGAIAGIKIPNTMQKRDKVHAGYKLPEVIIFCGVSDRELDIFLAEYKKAEIQPVALKAVMTQHNITWSIYELVQELQRERIAMMFGKK